MVHVCRDRDEIFEPHNKSILYKYNELKDQAAKYKKRYGKDKTYRLTEKRLRITKRLVSLPFEMWNHLLVGDKYLVFFPY